ncbi:MAG: AraC family transcriptional regulator [Bacteroidales bacterium]|nr:AraC family transcriptional regulator [Bacteroidales bacterium]
MSDAIEKIDFGALPQSDHTLIIQGRIYLDDNLDYDLPEEILHGSKRPYKLITSINILCHQGSLRITANQKEIYAQKNDLVILLPGTIVEGYELSPDCKLMLTATKINKEKQMDNLPPKSAMAIVSMLMGVQDPFKISFNDKFADVLRDQLLLERKTYPILEPDFIEDAIMGHFMSIASIIASWMQLNSSEKGPLVNRNRETELLAKFMDAIHKYASTERSVAFYADKACLSAKYFARIITKVSGKKPAFWIKQYAILEAKALLSSGQYSIQQVSDKMNFPNPSFFCKYFRQEVGMSPGKFMKSR